MTAGLSFSLTLCNMIFALPVSVDSMASASTTKYSESALAIADERMARGPLNSMVKDVNPKLAGRCDGRRGGETRFKMKRGLSTY